MPSKPDDIDAEIESLLEKAIAVVQARRAHGRVMPKPDDIDEEIEALREKAKKQPDRYGSDLAAAYLRRDKLHKRQFEASLKRRAAALAKAGK